MHLVTLPCLRDAPFDRRDLHFRHEEHERASSPDEADFYRALIRAEESGEPKVDEPETQPHA
jgi:hypothetical protein